MLMLPWGSVVIPIMAAMKNKPRIINLRGTWIVAEEFWRWPSTGALVYKSIGEGKTPKEAWDNAYPLSAIAKLKSWIKSCLNHMNT